MRMFSAAAIAVVMILLFFGAAAASETAAFIHGLDTLPKISKEEAENLPKGEEPVLLTLNGVRLPYDRDSNTYFIPQSAESEAYDGEIELAMEDGWNYYLLPSREGGKEKSIRTTIGYTIYGVKGDACISSKVIFTSLPVLDIETRSGDLPGEEDEQGFLNLFSAEYGIIWLDQTPIEINLRGNTSKRLPKKSYRVKIVDESGEKENLSIAGLRSDDDWILNPMYADTSKLREKLGYDLWMLMNSSGTAANSSRLEYAEVFINGRYWGLYGVQERIDRKQVDGNKRSGILYKVMANDRPTVDELRSCTSDEVCRGFELTFAGAGIEQPWEPAAFYMAFLDEQAYIGNARLSMDNVIDFGLWAMLIQAHDCHFKNQFLNCVYERGGHTIHKIPWDLNNTFGDVWCDDAKDTNYTDYRIGDLVMDGCFERFVESGDPAVYKAIQDRWSELRSGPVRTDLLLEQVRTLHEDIYPAIQRDSRRWTGCGMGEGNAANTRDIEGFLESTIPCMDTYIEQLGPEDTEDEHGKDMDR